MHDEDWFKKRLFLAGIGGGALALALSAAPAFAESGADQAGMPSAGKSATVHASGKVTAIDKGSRTVTVNRWNWTVTSAVSLTEAGGPSRR